METPAVGPLEPGTTLVGVKEVVPPAESVHTASVQMEVIELRSVIFTVSSKVKGNWFIHDAMELEIAGSFQN